MGVSRVTPHRAEHSGVRPKRQRQHDGENSCSKHDGLDRMVGKTRASALEDAGPDFQRFPEVPARKGRASAEFSPLLPETSAVHPVPSIERTREIAIRLALGASRSDVGALVFRRGMAIVSLGIAAGVAACVVAGPFLAYLLYGVSPRDPLAFTVGPVALVVVAAVAISLPARRAMQQDPIIALRAE